MRAVRGAYNHAIAARDADAIADCLADDYALTTSLGVRLRGRESALEIWRTRFAADPAAWYERNPRTVDVHRDGTADEHGRWRGRYTRDGKPVAASGSYRARWRCERDAWLVTEEVFTLDA